MKVKCHGKRAKPSINTILAIDRGNSVRLCNFIITLTILKHYYHSDRKQCTKPQQCGSPQVVFQSEWNHQPHTVSICLGVGAFVLCVACWHVVTTTMHLITSYPLPPTSTDYCIWKLKLCVGLSPTVCLLNPYAFNCTVFTAVVVRVFPIIAWYAKNKLTSLQGPKTSMQLNNLLQVLDFHYFNSSAYTFTPFHAIWSWGWFTTRLRSCHSI